MNPQRRMAYLQALGTPVWLPKALFLTGPEATDVASAIEASADRVPLTLALGDGTGGLLAICGSAQDIEHQVTADIVRVLEHTPVWAWPDGEGRGVALEAALDDRLFTAVLVFGQALANDLLGGEPPDHLGHARLVVAPSLGQLARDAAARRELWGLICRGGLVKAP